MFCLIQLIVSAGLCANGAIFLSAFHDQHAPGIIHTTAQVLDRGVDSDAPNGAYLTISYIDSNNHQHKVTIHHSKADSILISKSEEVDITYNVATPSLAKIQGSNPLIGELGADDWKVPAAMLGLGSIGVPLFLFLLILSMRRVVKHDYLEPEQRDIYERLSDD